VNHLSYFLLVGIQVVEDGYEFFADRQLVTIFSAPNYCGEFDNAGAMMSVDETLMCSFQILKPARKMLGGSTNTKSGFKVCMAKSGKVVSLPYTSMHMYIMLLPYCPPSKIGVEQSCCTVILYNYVIPLSLNLHN
jgi:hypothetical protein